MHRPFLNVGYIGLLVFGMSLILLMVFPSAASRLPDGFFTPVIAFEFVQTRVEVFQMFLQTNGAVRKDLVDAMNLGNRLDYIYMVLYTLFLMGFQCQMRPAVGKTDVLYWCGPFPDGAGCGCHGKHAAFCHYRGA